MAEFTPGPWEWRPYNAGGYALMNSEGVRIHSDGSACDEYGPDIDVDSPDAHLIAAAPEMYAALMTALPFFNNHRHYERGEDAYQACLAAIAKAEGKVPHGH